MFEFFRTRRAPSKAAGASSSAFDLDKLKLLIQYFPIGKKLRYYPEYQREIVFPTFVIAYRVNEQFLYSRDALLTSADGEPTGFALGDKKMLSVEKLTKLQILLPDTTDMEKSLDYFTRAELGRSGQFRQGNTITLVAETGARGIPTMDTKVDRRQTMKGGPYDDSSAVLVTPDFDTLVIADQRRKQRVTTAVLAYLFWNRTDTPLPCILADFSELSLRLNVRDEGQAMPPLQADDKVVIEFRLADTAAEYRLQGKLFRREDAFCVVHFDQIYRDGGFEKIKSMDIIEIKTGLLNREGA